MKPHPFGPYLPCKRCGKTFRYDYDGHCMDCADDLGISELFHDTSDPKESKPTKRTDERPQ